MGNRVSRLARNPLLWLPLYIAILLTVFATSGIGQAPHPNRKGTDGPANQGPLIAPIKTGNATEGKAIFRFGTFGDQGFWTNAARVPEGMMQAHVTPLKAMKIGLCFDEDKIDSADRRKLKQQLRKDPSGKRSALLNDPKTAIRWVNEDALIGLPVKPNKQGVKDIGKGGMIGVTCSLCHTITDGSLFKMPHGGSIGHREDGRSNLNISMGAVLATAANSRAVFPLLQLSLKANQGKTYGRAPKGLTVNSTEAEVDAYLKNPKYYPLGMFDDTYDGNGDQMQIAPLFRQDLAAPYLSGGTFLKAEDFSNLVYTSLFDPSTLVTPGGRKLLHKLEGAAGDEIANDYAKILKETGVTGYPYVKAKPFPAGLAAPVGLRVNEAKLLDLNAYIAQLPAPPGAKVDPQMKAEGRQLFRTVGCTGCHNVDQSKPVPTFIVPMKTIFPGDNPAVLAKRKPPLTPFELTPGYDTFDYKMAFINASLRGGKRGIAMPLLLDLARKPAFLHNDSVHSLNDLLNPSRGPKAPHPFYVSNAKKRAAVVDFLKSLDTNSH